MKTKETILITDDDPSMRTVLSALLQEENFRVLLAADGSECLRLAYHAHPDLVLLDILMEGKDGREVCKRLREVSNVPIIMLTGVSLNQEKIGRFADGADDYVTKPYNNDELIARIRAVLRRSRENPRDQLSTYDDGYLIVDFDSRQARVNGRAVVFSPKEWRLVECLMKQQGIVVPREALLQYGWGDGYEKEHHYLKVFIYHLRRKLGDPPRRPRYIHTERDLGYRFEGHA
ncbi:MAG: response regulator transcription factor [Chloroflexota bacterium]|nr:response regulator transcription factor [Chloroflexota bacterium]